MSDLSRLADLPGLKLGGASCDNTGVRVEPAGEVHPAPPLIRKSLSIMKACEVVGVSRRTIYNWMRAGKIEWVRTAGGSRRIFVDTLFKTGPA